MSHISNNDQLSRLLDFINCKFSEPELKILCFHLQVDYDNLSGSTKINRAAELIMYLERRDRIPDLAKQIKKLLHDNKAIQQQHNPSNVLPFTNPFGKTGKIQDSNYYLVRQPFTRNIIHELRKGVSLSIVGESQTGKSSLLWFVYQHGSTMLNYPAEDFVYLSLELINSDDDFFECLCDELGIATCRGFRLDHALRGRHIILCLDEIEKMIFEGFTLNVRTELRGLADGTHSPLNLVVASRTPLGRLFPDSPEMTSPLAGLCTQISIPNFNLKETHRLVEQYLDGTGFELPDADIEEAWRNADKGHPRKLQLALKEAFARRFS